ncbi:hypothetical protein [Thermus sp.]|uniref:hypothetical protein n=1 Tax=Thermus sp. TaxID=275 RepID=UPI00307FAD81
MTRPDLLKGRRTNPTTLWRMHKAYLAAKGLAEVRQENRILVEPEEARVLGEALDLMEKGLKPKEALARAMGEAPMPSRRGGKKAQAPSLEPWGELLEELRLLRKAVEAIAERLEERAPRRVRVEAPPPTLEEVARVLKGE